MHAQSREPLPTSTEVEAVARSGYWVQQQGAAHHGQCGSFHSARHRSRSAGTQARLRERLRSDDASSVRDSEPSFFMQDASAVTTSAVSNPFAPAAAADRFGNPTMAHVAPRFVDCCAKSQSKHARKGLLAYVCCSLAGTLVEILRNISTRDFLWGEAE